MRDSHRTFLQGFMARGILMGRDVRTLYNLCCTKYKDEDVGLAEFVSVINAAIKPLHLEIRKAIAEDTGAHCYGLVNTRDSDITKLASDYTVNELEYFKKVIEAIVESDTGTLPAIETLNLADNMDQRIAKKDAQVLLNKLEKEHWLTKSGQGLYSLSARSILELEQFLYEQYPDSTSKCNMCKRICVQGQSCTDCAVKLHIHCANTFFANKTDKICPGQDCQAVWTHAIVAPKGKGTGTDERSATPAPPTQPESRKRRAART